MAVKHSFVSPVADGDDSALVRPSHWNAAHSATPSEIAIIASPIIWLNMPALDTELLNTTNHRHPFDLSIVDEFRFVVKVTSAGFVGSDLRPQVSLDGGLIWSNLDGALGPEIDIGSIGVKVSPYSPLPLAHRADVLIRIMGKQGDGIVDPIFRGIYLQLR